MEDEIIMQNDGTGLQDGSQANEMKCKVCKKMIPVGGVHKDDLEHVIKDDVCWLCRARGAHVGVGTEGN